ncbi:MAG: hypothetical protein KZQ78_10215, partial [Candidatus Thiodiazotropha sp. (ex Ustalcina ferruginea)]|nr:hypothetical protein [Candidatus Thiodiazotropha sp. (ex Ustalcina ferruginea)]
RQRIPARALRLPGSTSLRIRYPWPAAGAIGQKKRYDQAQQDDRQPIFEYHPLNQRGRIGCLGTTHMKCLSLSGISMPVYSMI